MRRNRPITVALIGAGNRGADVYGDYIARHGDACQLVAAADPNAERLQRLKARHGLHDTGLFDDWRPLLAQPRLADLLIVATPDHVHVEPAIAALEKGYNLLLEKPLATNREDLDLLVRAARQARTSVAAAHVLRYTPFFRAIKELLTGGRIGHLVSVNYLENIGFWHFAHSYVRGNWRNHEAAAPLILAKSCHDLDILLWLIDRPCLRVSSFGALTHFTQEQAPQGAASRCLDCPVERECPYSAVRYYIEQCRDVHDWPISVITNDTSLEGRIQALRDGPYGRCAFYCDNDVPDHQVAALEFAGDITATLTVCAFTAENTRTLKLMGSAGEIRGHLDRGEIEVRDFLSGEQERILVPSGGGHAGGDDGLMAELITHLKESKGSGSQPLSIPTALASALESHWLAFAAEESRLARRTVELQPVIEP